MGLSADDYLVQLQHLLPPGDAWPREDGRLLTCLLLALADEYARIDARDKLLLDQECFPDSANEMLPDWERVYGLPCDCVEDGQTLDERRAALLAKITVPGGLSPAYYIAVAALLGYTITISEFLYPPFVAGSAAGDLIYSDAWTFLWGVNSSLDTVRTFRVGRNTVGEPLRDWGNEELECAIERLKPAHTLVEFSYT